MKEEVKPVLSERLRAAMAANVSFASQDIQALLLESAERIQQLEKQVAALSAKK